ncbi:hypothetical protein [Actinomycetospora soli]|uniref:hypothetical protein n=1 Tax=Actinomycetospora soli TaxID=2893887 RepID=UPI001E3803B5|nr:hypothetical protein [Actinomycetospora soli]MCD2190200.1 hypothetical protein [Actinomycetospora soli]
MTATLTPGRAPAVELTDAERVWRGSGLTGRFAAVHVPGEDGTATIGLVAASGGVATVEAVRRLDRDGPLRPAVVQFGGLVTTASGDPRRGATARALTAARGAGDGPDPHRTLADRLGGRCPGPTVRLDLRAGDDPVRAAREGLVIVLHGPDHDRWDAVHALLGLGAVVVGTAAVRDGTGGVVWGRYGTRRPGQPVPVTAST